MKIDFKIDEIETKNPNVEMFFVPEYDMVLMELINLNDLDYNFLINDTELAQEIIFEGNLLALRFPTEKIQYVVDISETQVHEMFNDGKIVGFSFKNEKGETHKQIAVFSHEKN